MGKHGYTLTMKLSEQCGTRTCLEAMTMFGWTRGVLICCFIVSLLLLRHIDLFYFSLGLEYISRYSSLSLRHVRNNFPRVLLRDRVKTACSSDHSDGTSVLSKHARDVPKLEFQLGPALLKPLIETSGLNRNLFTL